MRRVKTRGQSLTEVALCLAAVVAIIMTVRIYIQRSLQARYKGGADYLISEIKNTATDKGVPNFTKIKQQYDPYYRESDTIEVKSGSSATGFPDTSIDQTTTRSGWEKTGSAPDAD